MAIFFRYIILLGFSIFPIAALATEPREISWSNLAPPPAVIENPFEDLTLDQMDSLRLILRYDLSTDKSSDTKEQELVQNLRTQLTEDGLDVDALFQARLDIIAARQLAATRVNESITGDTIRMAGYLLPLTLTGRSATEFLLVPTFGACIHTPPPAANQVVHVVYPDGIEVEGLFTPVWITGPILAQSSLQDVRYSDGRAPVSVSYAMQADMVVKFGE